MENDLLPSSQAESLKLSKFPRALGVHMPVANPLLNFHYKAKKSVNLLGRHRVITTQTPFLLTTQRADSTYTSFQRPFVTHMG